MTYNLRACGFANRVAFASETNQGLSEPSSRVQLNRKVRHMRRGVYQMFGLGLDQLSGYCPQVLTMLVDSAFVSP